MSNTGNPHGPSGGFAPVDAWTNPASPWPNDNCGESTDCLRCRDCRTGFMVNVDACLPVVDVTYTSNLNGATHPFTVRFADYGIDTANDIFLGQYIAGDGKSYYNCCSKVIGYCAIDAYIQGSGLLENVFCFVEVRIGSDGNPWGNDNAFSIVIRPLYYSGEFYWFRSDRAAVSGRSSTGPIECLICSFPPGVYTSIAGTNPDDYIADVAYIEESETMAISAIPIYSNQVGTNTTKGRFSVREVTTANDLDTYCGCTVCTSPTTFTMTIEGLTSICLVVMQPEDDTQDIPIDLDPDPEVGTGKPTYASCAPPSGDAAATLESVIDDLPVVTCGTNPDAVCFQTGEVSKYSITATIEALGGGYDDYKGVKITLDFSFRCGGESSLTFYTATAEVYLDYRCTGGIIDQTVTGIDVVEVYPTPGGTIGTIDVTISTP